MAVSTKKSRSGLIPKPARVDVRKAAASCDPRPNTTPSVRAQSENSLTALRNIRMMHLLERVVTKFNEAGVPIMALKGAALNLTLYQKPDERSMVDLDLMVRPEHLDQATALLEEIGCLRNQVLMREDFFPRFYYELEYRSGDLDPVIIDLHVRPFRPMRYARIIPADAFWDRARPVEIGSASVLVPCPEDMLIHLAVHCAIHNNDRPAWLKDIKQWVESHRDQINWDQLVQTATQWRLALPVVKAIAAAEQFFVTRLCPTETKQQLARTSTNWRDRLALSQAPRDNAHPIAHVLVNVLCTPNLWFTVSYLLAVLVPHRDHMGEWYCHRHYGWLPYAHVLRWLWPIIGRIQRIQSWLTRIEVRESPKHGNGVFATRDIAAGQTITRYHLKPVDRTGTYVVSHKKRPDGSVQYYAITGKLRFLNHYCKANAELLDLKLVALRMIRAGEEITIDYGIDACSCRQNKHSRQAPITEEELD